MAGAAYPPAPGAGWIGACTSSRKVQGPVQEPPLVRQSEGEDGDGSAHLKERLLSSCLPHRSGGAAWLYLSQADANCFKGDLILRFSLE